MAPLFPNKTVPQMCNYAVWLQQITTKSPADYQETAPDPGLAVWKSQL